MAIINVDDAYILNETGAQVDKTTGIPFKNESLTEAEAAQARANIRAGGSNRNLLDNAYFVGGGSQLGDGVFPINQRGQASYGSSMYGIDRWRTWGNMPVALTAAGLSLTSTEAAGLFQYPEQNRIMAMMGETVTFSVKVAGQVYSNTGTIYSGTWLAVQVPSGEAIFVVPQSYPSELISVSYRFSGAVSTPVVLQAMKLELGTVSTLANDAPPDFGEELRKCQRYLRYVSLKRLPVFCDANYLIAMTTLEGIEMRATPTPTLVSAGYILNPAASATSVPTAVSILSFEYNTASIQLSIPAAFSGFCLAVDGAICLSAEL